MSSDQFRALPTDQSFMNQMRGQITHKIEQRSSGPDYTNSYDNVGELSAILEILNSSDTAAKVAAQIAIGPQIADAMNTIDQNVGDDRRLPGDSGYWALFEIKHSRNGAADALAIIEEAIADGWSKG